MSVRISVLRVKGQTRFSRLLIRIEVLFLRASLLMDVCNLVSFVKDLKNIATNYNPESENPQQIQEFAD